MDFGPASSFPIAANAKPRNATNADPAFTEKGEEKGCNATLKRGLRHSHTPPRSILRIAASKPLLSGLRFRDTE
jgi:hypothetical protein